MIVIRGFAELIIMACAFGLVGYVIGVVSMLGEWRK